ncbi:MAG: hypothetical protein IT539_13830 [Bradyrhizobiaceae bacterium]|nr:hypothetical protein [Bradyrhizobiaceae bacterium]
MTDLRNLSTEELLALRNQAAGGQSPLSQVPTEQLLAMREQAQQSGGVLDTARQLGYGAVEAGAGLVGMPGDVGRLMDTGIDWAARKLGLPEKGPRPSGILPTSGEVLQAIRPVTGDMPRSDSTVGQYARTVGNFAAGALAPGGVARRAAQVVLPAVASETAGRYAPQGYEGLARLGGALAGGVAASARMPSIGAASRANRALSEMVTPQTQARLRELGPDAFLFEGNPTLTQTAQGVVQRPGAAAEQLRSAVTARHKLAPERLQTEIQQSFGRPVAPSRVQTRIDKAQQALAPDYRAAVATQTAPANVRPIVGVLDDEISRLAGAPKKALIEIKSFLFDNGRLKTNADELLSVRAAIDDMVPRFEGQKNALRVISETRQSIDDAIRQAAPAVKAVDARFAALAKQSESLEKGGQILATGKEAIRPSELAQALRTMSPQQQASLRMGARAEIDRVVGTALHDINAVRNLVKGEGKWNWNKLAQVFGTREADRVFGAIDREVAFRQAYDSLIANSQTAPRQVAEAMTRVAGPGNLTPEAAGAIAGLTLTGNPAVAAGGAAMVGGVKRGWGALASGGQRRLDQALVQQLGSQGNARDQILQILLNDQFRRRQQMSVPQELVVRALLAGQGVSAGGGR